MLKKFNTPFPQTLPKECAKAAKIFHSFVDNGNNGLDGVVPRAVLENAKGFAIFSVVKAGFVFSARAGSGIVIARTDDGSWSAPSAIGTAGLGVGGQAGAEVTDFLIVLNSRSALRSFMSAGSLTLGGNLSIAVGPMGRNGEAIGSLSTSGKLAAMYSYSKTRGLFGGVSLEGSVIVERQDANAIAYRSDDVTVKMLLSGAVPPMDWASPLIQTLEQCTGMPGNHKWVQDRPPSTPASDGGSSYDGWGARGRGSGEGYAFGGVASPGSKDPLGKKKKKGGSGSFPPASWGKSKNTGSYFAHDADEFGAHDYITPARDDDLTQGIKDMSLTGSSAGGGVPAPATFEMHFDSDFIPDEESRKHPLLHNKPSAPSGTTSQQPGNLIDISDGPASPLDFDPLGPSAGATSRPSHLRSQSNPYFSAAAQTQSPFTPLPPYSAAPTRALSHAPGPASGYYSAFPPHARADSSGSLSYMTVNSRVGAGRSDSTSPPLRSGTASSPPPQLKLKPELTQPLPSYAVGRAIALFDFDAVESGDLSFKTGQVVTILEKSNSTDAWWKGTREGHVGIFPANFVELV